MSKPTTEDLIDNLISCAGYAGHGFLFSMEVKGARSALLAHLEGAEQKSELERDFPPMGGLTECDMGDSYE